MKNIARGLAAAIAILIMGLSVAAYAEDATVKPINTGPAYVDQNKNGICDRKEARFAAMKAAGYAQGWQYRQGMRGRMMGMRGLGFVDVNNNGICDRLE